MPASHRVASASAFAALIDRIYEAALDASLWPVVLESIIDVVGATAASLPVWIDTGGSGIQMAVTAGLHPDAAVAYRLHYGALDPWLREGQRRGLVQTGFVAQAEQIVPHTDLIRSEFFTDYGDRFGIVRGVTGIISADARMTAAISVYGPTSREPFGPRDVTLVRRLLPHLRRALRVHERFATLQLDCALTCEALDRMVCAAIVASADGRVLFTNRAAEEIISARDGLSRRGDRLQPALAAEAVELRDSLHRLRTPPPGDGRGGMMRVSRPSGKRPYVLLVTPLRTRLTMLDFRPCDDQPAGLLFVHDPETQRLSTMDRLRRSYGFTPSEARLATALLDGDQLNVVADHLCISLHTARSHLKHLLSKTNTKRQADLLRVLLADQPPVKLD